MLTTRNRAASFGAVPIRRTCNPSVSTVAQVIPSDKKREVMAAAERFSITIAAQNAARMAITAAAAKATTASMVCDKRMKVAAFGLVLQMLG